MSIDVLYVNRDTVCRSAVVPNCVNASITVKVVGGISSCNGGKLDKSEGYNCFLSFLVC